MRKHAFFVAVAVSAVVACRFPVCLAQFTESASSNLATLDSIEYANAFPGSADQQISTAISNLPSAGGTVDARGIHGPQTWSQCPRWGTNPITLWLGAGIVGVAANCTVPSNVALRFGEGTILAPALSTTLTIAGSVEAPIYSRIFAGPGSVIFQNAHNVYGTWFGMVGDGTTDNLNAFGSAIAAVQGTGGKLIIPAAASEYHASGGQYINTGAWTLAGTGCSRDGSGVLHGSVIDWGLAVGYGTVGTYLDDFHVENLCLDESVSGSSAISSSGTFQHVQQLVMRDVISNGKSGADGVNLSDAQHCLFENVGLYGYSGTGAAWHIGNAFSLNTIINPYGSGNGTFIGDFNTGSTDTFIGGSCDNPVNYCVKLSVSLAIVVEGMDMENGPPPTGAWVLISGGNYDSLIADTIANNTSGSLIVPVQITGGNGHEIIGGAVTVSTSIAAITVAASAVNTLIENVYSNGAPGVAVAAGAKYTTIIGPNGNDPYTDAGTATTVLGASTSTASISSGSGVPSGSCTNGSIYANVAGRLGSTLYVCVAGSWVDVK